MNIHWFIHSDFIRVLHFEFFNSQSIHQSVVLYGAATINILSSTSSHTHKIYNIIYNIAPYIYIYIYCLIKRILYYIILYVFYTMHANTHGGRRSAVSLQLTACTIARLTLWRAMVTAETDRPANTIIKHTYNTLGYHYVQGNRRRCRKHCTLC